MTETPVEKPPPGRWRRRLLWALAGFLLVLALIGYAIKDDLRSLASVRRVANTNLYVMDYYGDYNMERIRRNGMDVEHIEESYLEAALPQFTLPIARRLRRWYVPEEVHTVGRPSHNCSTLFLRTRSGTCYLARNFDYHNDACLIVRTHDANGIASLAVIDLAYLNLDRPDLDSTSLIERVPLLFAPYFAMDGVNRYGVAVSVMSVPAAMPPRRPGRPAVTNSTLMRLILDYAHDVDEAVAMIQRFNVHFVKVPQHVLIADQSGDRRIIEFLDGEIRETTCDEDWQICTNHQMWLRSEAENDTLCRRYRIGSEVAESLDYEIDTDIDDVQRAIRSMSVDGWTMWTSIYNLSTGEANVAYRSQWSSQYDDQLPLRAHAPNRRRLLSRRP
jgi:hypothetical protein